MQNIRPVCLQFVLLDKSVKPRQATSSTREGSLCENTRQGSELSRQVSKVGTWDAQVMTLGDRVGRGKRCRLTYPRKKLVAN